MVNRIAVLWDTEIDMQGEKPFEEEKWNIDYEAFSEKAKDRDVELFLANFREYGQGNIEEAYVYREGNWERVEEVDIDGIFDKYSADEETQKRKYEIAEEVPILNDPRLEKICKDKLETYQRFPEQVPETRRATGENIEEMIENEGRAVVKPRYDFGGKGIQILESLEELDPVDPEDHIVQEFVDASQGVPGTEYEGVHDIRSILVSGRLVSGFIRVPDEGLISNVMQGGRMDVFLPNRYPESAREAIKEVAESLEEYEPSIYAVDLIFDSDGEPRVVELNSKPSLSFHDSEKYREDKMRVVEEIIDIFSEF